MEKTVEITDKKYPKALKEALGYLVSSQGPKRLFYKGVWSDEIFQNCLAVVGSRHLTHYGRQATERIVTECAVAGITIVSGFMYGGDEAAHSAAVRCGRTIAVMPCGIDLIHPPGQKDLYKKILDTGGLIISEYESDLQPQNWMYVQRDRIVAGLSKAVLVTEAALDSGSLITAGYAKKYNRKVFAIPGPITSEVSRGTIKLIKEGAEPVTEAKDILDFFKITPKFSKSKSVQNLNDRVVYEHSPAGTLEQKIIDQLKREPMKADEMARLFSVPVAHLGTTLSLMQLKGFISQDSGKYYIN
jgi:DNA processing protein